MNWWQNLWFETKRGWVAFVSVVVLVGGSVLADIRHTAWVKAEGQTTTATITSFYTDQWGQKWRPGSIIVEAKADNGVLGVRTLPRDRLKGCEVGDRIPATQVGGSLRLDPWSCNGRFPVRARQ